MNYFEEEEKANIKQLRKMSGAKTFKIGLELIRFGIKTMKSSIQDKHPGLSPKNLDKRLKARLKEA